MTDLLESVSLSQKSSQEAALLRPAQGLAPGGGRAPLAPMPRLLEGHNSAPDLLPGFWDFHEILMTTKTMMTMTITIMTMTMVNAAEVDCQRPG